MSDTTRLLKDSADRLFGDSVDDGLRAAVRDGEFPEEFWTAIEAMGLPDLFGFGEPADAHAVLRSAGYHAAPAPLAETLIAKKLVARYELADPGGAMTVAPVWDGERLRGARDASGWIVEGRLNRIPWLRHAKGMVAALDLAGAGAPSHLVCLVPDQYETLPDRATHDEPRDTAVVQGLRLGDNEVVPLIQSDDATRIGALIRACQMAGALEAVLDITVRYAGEREQFGRPLAKFQAIQQQLAALAGEVSAGAVAARDAIETLDESAAVAPAAAAKARLGAAAGEAAAIAHQAHGAIGFTAEYSLHHRTKRLWAWRDDFGTERFWRARLGQFVTRGGQERIWQMLSEVE